MAHVLVADDDQVVRVFLRRVLEDAEHEPRFACTGEDALRVFLEHHIDLVITDLAMPKRSGLWLIGEIRNARPTVPIIAISGMDETLLVEAEALGATAVLAKPLDRAALLDTVQQRLQLSNSVWGPGY